MTAHGVGENPFVSVSNMPFLYEAMKKADKILNF